MRQRRVYSIRALATFVVAASILAGLVGCAPKGGQSNEQAISAMRHTAGVGSARAFPNSFYAGLSKATSMYIEVTIDAGYRIASPPNLMEYLIRTAWSVNSGHPNDSLSIEVHSVDSPSFDPIQAAIDAGWDSDRLASNPPMPEMLSVVLNDSLVAKLGPWPGRIPTLPQGTIVPVER